MTRNQKRRHFNPRFSSSSPLDGIFRIYTLMSTYLLFSNLTYSTFRQKLCPSSKTRKRKYITMKFLRLLPKPTTPVSLPSFYWTLVFTRVFLRSWYKRFIHVNDFLSFFYNLDSNSTRFFIRFYMIINYKLTLTLGTSTVDSLLFTG